MQGETKERGTREEERGENGGMGEEGGMVGRWGWSSGGEGSEGMSSRRSKVPFHTRSKCKETHYCRCDGGLQVTQPVCGRGSRWSVFEVSFYLSYIHFLSF